jgi:hypothetical protein
MNDLKQYLKIEEILIEFKSKELYGEQYFNPMIGIIINRIDDIGRLYKVLYDPKMFSQRPDIPNYIKGGILI